MKVAGVGSELRARSTVRTANVCVPGSRPCTLAGESHGSNAPPSTEHSNARNSSGVALSVPAKVNTTSGSIVIAGGWVRTVVRSVVSGVVASATEVHVWTTGVGSTLPSEGD